MSTVNTTSLLRDLQQLRTEAAGPAAGAETGGFAEVMQSLLHGVNGQQLEASQMAQSFELGEGKADLAQVMINLQKARIGFQSTLQVRNRLMSAYHDIMNMPI